MKEETITVDQIHSVVQKYYSTEVKSARDLKTSACCISDSLPLWQREIIKQIEPETLDKFYGCGSPIPSVVEGKTVLDLGCGTGRDVYLVSKIVGENGFVIGVDMTDEQLEVANKYKNHHAEKFGYSKSNVDFRKGFIEDLKSCGIEDNSIDIVISNCVINLAENKDEVFKEIFRVLKPGGELFFSDVFADRRIPLELKNDPVLYGECLSNAMYTEDFRRMLLELGINDFRILSSRKISLDNPEIENKIGFINFYSNTVRVFKLYNLEDKCEDYGQIAKYNGTIENHPHFFDLDDHHHFETGKPMLVCGNTFDMLNSTRLSHHFELIGDKSKHFGLFSCGNIEVKNDNACSTGTCC
ncbi:MAG: methyltransferase domain-containing protein [Ignavibacteriales bacterium]